MSFLKQSLDNIKVWINMGIEEDNSYREHNNPDDEGILYDNLD